MPTHGIILHMPLEGYWRDTGRIPEVKVQHRKTQRIGESFVSSEELYYIFSALLALHFGSACKFVGYCAVQ